MRTVPFNRDALKRVGVTLSKAGGGWLLSCDKCGQSWPVHVHVLARDYWRCPNGCEVPTPKPKRKPKPKPKPEPEPVENPLEKAISKALESYSLYQRKMREAQTDEETEAYRAKSEEFLDKYLAAIGARNEGGTEPSNEQKRFEEALDRYLTGGNK